MIQSPVSNWIKFFLLKSNDLVVCLLFPFLSTNQILTGEHFNLFLVFLWCVTLFTEPVLLLDRWKWLSLCFRSEKWSSSPSSYTRRWKCGRPMGKSRATIRCSLTLACVNNKTIRSVVTGVREVQTSLGCPWTEFISRITWYVNKLRMGTCLSASVGF